MRAFVIPILAAAALPQTGARPPAVKVSVPIVSAAVASEDGPLLAFEVIVEAEAGPAPAISDVTIADADGGRILARYNGTELSRRVDQSKDGKVTRVFAEIMVDPSPAAISVRVSLAQGGLQRTVASKRVTVDRVPVVELGPPLRGGAWVAVHHPDWPRGHRRVVYDAGGVARIPGRFAVDWVGVDPAGLIADGDPDRPSDAIGYGSPVLAGADGVVAEVRDGMPESGSIAANPSQKERFASGNYVSLKIGPRRFAIYEHLKPGSVRVRSGQRMKSGDIIGALGFTGDSTGPYLHLHVAECATPLACEGGPFTIRGMIVNERYVDVGDMGGRPWSTLTGRQRLGASWPGYNVVVSFPGTR